MRYTSIFLRLSENQMISFQVDQGSLGVDFYQFLNPHYTRNAFTIIYQTASGIIYLKQLSVSVFQ
jgi:hypothetical protein